MNQRRNCSITNFKKRAKRARQQIPLLGSLLYFHFLHFMDKKQHFRHELIAEFLAHKQYEEWLQPISIIPYISLFDVLAIYIDFNMISESWKIENIRKAMITTAGSRDWKPKTWNNYRKYLICFGWWLQKEGKISTNSATQLKKQSEGSKLPKTLRIEEVFALKTAIFNCWQSSTEYNRERNRLIFLTLIYSGMRRKEIANLRLSDVDLELRVFRINNGKMGKDRIIPIPQDLIGQLVNYLEIRYKMAFKSDFLFATKSGCRLDNNRDMSTIIRELREKTTFHFTYHQLRHTYATELVRNNVDLFSISKILGHSKTTTTEIYLSVSTETIKNKIAQVDFFR